MRAALVCVGSSPVLCLRVGAVTTPRQAARLAASVVKGRKREVELGTACTGVLGVLGENFLFDIDSIRDGAQ